VRQVKEPEMPRHYNRKPRPAKKTTAKKKNPSKMLLEDRFPTPGTLKTKSKAKAKPKAKSFAKRGPIEQRLRDKPKPKQMSEAERWIRSHVKRRNEALRQQRSPTANESLQLEGYYRGLSPIRTWRRGELLPQPSKPRPRSKVKKGVDKAKRRLSAEALSGSQGALGRALSEQQLFNSLAMQNRFMKNLRR
jgi:hypothetical protein